MKPERRRLLEVLSLGPWTTRMAADLIGHDPTDCGRILGCMQRGHWVMRHPFGILPTHVRPMVPNGGKRPSVWFLTEYAARLPPLWMDEDARKAVVCAQGYDLRVPSTHQIARRMDWPLVKAYAALLYADRYGGWVEPMVRSELTTAQSRAASGQVGVFWGLTRKGRRLGRGEE